MLASFPLLPSFLLPSSFLCNLNWYSDLFLHCLPFLLIHFNCNSKYCIMNEYWDALCLGYDICFPSKISHILRIIHIWKNTEDDIALKNLVGTVIFSLASIKLINLEIPLQCSLLHISFLMPHSGIEQCLFSSSDIFYLICFIFLKMTVKMQDIYLMTC